MPMHGTHNLQLAIRIYIHIHISISLLIIVSHIATDIHTIYLNSWQIVHSIAVLCAVHFTIREMPNVDGTHSTKCYSPIFSFNSFFFWYLQKPPLKFLVFVEKFISFQFSVNFPDNITLCCLFCIHLFLFFFCGFQKYDSHDFVWSHDLRNYGMCDKRSRSGQSK